MSTTYPNEYWGTEAACAAADAEITRLTDAGWRIDHDNGALVVLVSSCGHVRCVADRFAGTCVPVGN